MRRFGFIAVILLSGLASGAENLVSGQNPFSQEMMRVELTQARAKVFETAMKDLPPADLAKFWPLYNEYAQNKVEYDRRRLQLLDQYITNYLSLTPKQTTELMDGWIDLQKEELASRVSMFKTLSRKVSPFVAARFYQVDDYIQTDMKLQYFRRYPFMGDSLH